MMSTTTAGITLVPCDVALHAYENLSPLNSRQLIFSARLEQDSDVRQADDRSLKDARWMASFIEGESYNQHATEQGAIGFLKYWPASKLPDNEQAETCYVSVALKRDMFAALLSAAQSGQLPDKLDFEVRGLSYGRKPDGSDAIWDTSDGSALPVLEARFSVPLVGPRGDEHSVHETVLAELRLWHHQARRIGWLLVVGVFLLFLRG
jgi:hypothetical protein